MRMNTNKYDQRLIIETEAYDQAFTYEGRNVMKTFKKTFQTGLCMALGFGILQSSFLPVLAAQNGWEKTGSSWSYIVNGSPVRNSFQEIEGETYYFDGNGVMMEGFLYDQVQNRGLFLTNKGLLKNSWTKETGYWHYFDENGECRPGWQQVNGSWYYFYGNLTMAANQWAEIDGEYYYFNESGAMLTGWFKEGNDWYMLTSKGALRSSWYKEGNNWYFFQKNNKMARGFLEICGQMYHFGSDGIMSTGQKVIDGVSYTFDANGIMTNGYSQPVIPIVPDTDYTVPEYSAPKPDTSAPVVPNKPSNELGGTMSPSAGSLSFAEYSAKVEQFISDPRFASGAQYDISMSPYLVNNPYAKGCVSYGIDFMMYVFGKEQDIYQKDFSDVNSIQSGDILRLNSPVHTLVVLYRNGNELVTAEGNFGGLANVSSTAYKIENGMLVSYGNVCGFDYGMHTLPAGIDSMR